jgi:hypothetical protein
MSFTEAWAEGEAAANAQSVTLLTLEFFHPSFLNEQNQPVSVRAVDDTRDHSLLLESAAPLNGGQAVTFTAIPFRMLWPTQDDGRAPEMRIEIDNVGREITDRLDAAIEYGSPITVIFRAYVFAVPTGQTTLAFDPQEFTLRSVTVTDESVEGVASLGDLANKRAFSYVYNLVDYPGLNQSG